MDRRWWVGVVAVVGIGVAILLFPRTQAGDKTGSGVPVTSADDANSVAAVGPHGSPDGRLGPGAPGQRLEISRDAQELERRSRLESVYASKLVSPFSAIRYSLARADARAAKPLIDEIGMMMGDLRRVRRDPDSMAWSALQAEMDTMVAKVQTSVWGKDPTIAEAIGRYRADLGEYEIAKAAGAGSSTAASAPRPSAQVAP